MSSIRQIVRVFFNNLLVDLQKLKSHLNLDPRTYSSTDSDFIKLELRDLKLKLERLNDDLAHKSNIKDVCALVDLKANSEEVDKKLEAIFKEI